MASASGKAMGSQTLETVNRPWAKKCPGRGREAVRRTVPSAEADSVCSTLAVPALTRRANDSTATRLEHSFSQIEKGPIL